MQIRLKISEAVQYIRSNIIFLCSHHSVAVAPPPQVGSCPQLALVQEMDSCSGKRGKASG